MKIDFLAELEAALVGNSCSITRREYDWLLVMNSFVSITLSVPWRIVSKGRIVLASADDGQTFGLSAPVNGEKEARKICSGKRIAKASVDRQTADIALQFDSETRFDAFNNSSGYEGWQARYMSNGQWHSVIALGGGEVTFFTE